MKVKLVFISVIVVAMLAAVLPATAGAKTGQGASVWNATLTAANTTPVWGTAHFVLNRQSGKLIVSLHVSPLGSRALHTVAITGFPGGTPAASLPGAEADVNGDGFITYDEVTPFTGAPLVWLGPWANKKSANANLHVKLGHGQLKKLDPIGFMLGRCAIVVYGATFTPVYGEPVFDPTAPLAYGLVKAR
jgi:hypothetical protein